MLILRVISILVEVFKKHVSRFDIIPKTLNFCKEFVLHSNCQEVVESCFKIFQMLIEDKSILAESTLPKLIDFCLTLSKIEELPLETQSSLYSMIDRLLFYHWGYFFVSKVTTRMKKPAGNDKPQEFMSLFEVSLANAILVKSFYQNETDLIRQNLIAIRNLNSQWKILENVYTTN